MNTRPTAAALLSACAFALIAASHAAEPMTYEMFGAKGDGKTDDRAAIIATHKAANEKGAPVRAKDGATYYVKSDEGTAEVKTDVDFGTAKFVIDDTKVEKISSPLLLLLRPSPQKYNVFTSADKIGLYSLPLVFTVSAKASATIAGFFCSRMLSNSFIFCGFSFQ